MTQNAATRISAEQFTFDETWTPVETVVSGDWRMIRDMFNSHGPSQGN